MKAIVVNEAIYQYVNSHCESLHPALNDLIAETQKLEYAVMQISPDQGVFMHMLAKLMGAKRILEVGCFTGYSAISMALALPSDGKLITLDIDAKNTAIAQKYFNKTDLANRIELKLGDAKTSLKEIEQNAGSKSFDMMFIDADKENQWDYFESGLRLVRKGGLIIVDNVLWSGRVTDLNDQTGPTRAIRAFNERLKTDTRVEKLMLAVADGLYLARVK